MMRFAEEREVTHKPELVLETMIERMNEIVPFLPSIESIETREHETLPDGRIRIVRYWQAKPDSAPSAVRPFVTKEHLGWIDTALWTPSEFKVDWTLSTSMSKFYTCGGTNSFGPHPDRPENTLVRIAGELEIYADKLPGVPGFIGKRIAPQVEKFVVNMITPNLVELAPGLQGYLDGRG
ncbi:MAG: hypothetical protein H6744_09690 [Deltaproteobacteria bacterium]|nr:hypothetical protein [Deltaproteobacteria bacterium]